MQNGVLLAANLCSEVKVENLFTCRRSEIDARGV
jgi:hypothetical protein